MENIRIILKYGGNWDENGHYINYKMRGMLLSCNASYNEMCERISQHMKMDKDISNLNMKISYRIEGDSTPIWISSDMDLEFYVDLKKNNEDASKYALFIETEENASMGDSTIWELHEINTEVIPLDQIQESHEMSTQLSMPYLNRMVEYTSSMAEKAVAVCEGSTATEESHEGNIDFRERIDMNCGYVFSCKEEAQKAISHHALQNQFNFKVDKSCSKRYYVSCIDENCLWHIHTSSVGHTNAFMVRKACNNHTCTMENRFSAKRHASSKFIASFVEAKFRGTTSYYGPKNIQEDMKYKYGLDIDYHKAWRAKENVYGKVIGKASTSYGDLPTYLCMVSINNPGSLTEIKTTDDGSFLYAFMALSSFIEGWKYCRPQVVMDGAFLSSAYGGCLLTACTYNANGGILLLAFAIVDSENNNSYNWFLGLFRRAYGFREGMCIISDRHESISNAARNVYPEAGHYHCIFHLEANIKKVTRRNHKTLHHNLFKAAKAYTLNEFNYYLCELIKMGKVVEKLITETVPVEQWAATHSKQNRRQAMTSNIVESLNSANKEARNLPVTVLMEHLRALCQRWSVNNRKEAMNTLSGLTSKYHSIVLNSLMEACTYQVTKSSEYIYKIEVVEEGKNYVVNLETRTCSCQKFQTDEYPCKHAMPIISQRSLEIRDYSSIYYHNETLKKTYESVVHPVSTYDTTQVPEDASVITVHKPARKPKVGRPRKRRFRSKLEKQKWNLCGNCRQPNHNRSTCNNYPLRDV